MEFVENKKQERLHAYCASADVVIEDNYRRETIPELPLLLLTSIYNPICIHKTVYVNGPEGCGKTTRVIELFRKSFHKRLLTNNTDTHTCQRDDNSKNKFLYLS